MLRPKGLDHVGLVVAGLDRSLHFDCDGRGPTLLRRKPPGIEAVIEGLRQAGIAVARGPVARRDATSLLVIDPDGVQVELAVKT